MYLQVVVHGPNAFREASTLTAWLVAEPGLDSTFIARQAKSTSPTERMLVPAPHVRLDAVDPPAGRAFAHTFVQWLVACPQGHRVDVRTNAAEVSFAAGTAASSQEIVDAIREILLSEGSG